MAAILTSMCHLSDVTKRGMKCICNACIKSSLYAALHIMWKLLLRNVSIYFMIYLISAYAYHFRGANIESEVYRNSIYVSMTVKQVTEYIMSSWHQLEVARVCKEIFYSRAPWAWFFSMTAITAFPLRCSCFVWWSTQSIWHRFCYYIQRL